MSLGRLETEGELAAFIAERVAEREAAIRAFVAGGGWVAVALAGGWGNTGGVDAEGVVNEVAGYSVGAGFVELRGLVTGGAVGTAMFNLPSPARPPRTRRFSVFANSAWGGLVVRSSGDVVLTVGSNIDVDLSAVTFRL